MIIILVSAASIYSQTGKGCNIIEINKDYIKMGGIGSGYPSDPDHSKKFLTNFTYDEMPEFCKEILGNC